MSVELHKKLHFKSGDHVTELYSNIGLAYMINARTRNPTDIRSVAVYYLLPGVP